MSIPRHLEDYLDQGDYGTVVYEMIEYLQRQYIEVVGAPTRQTHGTVVFYVGGRKTNYEWDHQEVRSDIQDAADYAGLEIADISPAPTHNPGDMAVELFFI